MPFRSLALTTLLAAVGAAPSRAQPASPTRLVVLITVDQMRADYLDRFKGQFTGGLARLTSSGAVFTNAFQDHANTETAPGHATTLSGREPRSTGIVLNEFGVPDPQAPLIGGGGPGASPYRFRGETLIDWMRVADPRSRALSVSRKDRGAILPLGRAHQSVYWYANDGRFTTSTYYADTLPTWVQRFNARKLPQQYAGKSWTLLLPESAYPERDSVPIESGARDFVFPHVMSSDSATAASLLIAFPWMDEVTASLALEGVAALNLGAGPATDLLAVSLSTTDAVGHRFGMDSRELHDQIVRLDRTLGVFLDSLFKMRNPASVIVALTSDHGVSRAPELLKASGQDIPWRADLAELAQRYETAMAARGLGRGVFSYDDAMLTLDRTAFARAGVDADSVLDAFIADAKREPGVGRADKISALAKADTVKDPVARRWLHAVPPDLPIEVVVTLKPGSVWGDYATGIHGGPSDDDAHVPVVFYGPPFKPGRYGEFARVTDLAATLAAVLNVRPTNRLDGRVLRSAIR
jgi:hypothetical protein